MHIKNGRQSNREPHSHLLFLRLLGEPALRVDRAILGADALTGQANRLFRPSSNPPTVAEMAAVIMEHRGKKLGSKKIENVLRELESLSDTGISTDTILISGSVWEGRDDWGK